jgi:PHP family Zn ribbon phosphoesterase
LEFRRIRIEIENPNSKIQNSPVPRFAADLHLHSRYSRAVSRAMTLPAIVRAARESGMDLLSTGDCLQPAWLEELEHGLTETSPGWFAPTPAIDATANRDLPESLRRPLRFVLGTEVHCAPAGTPELGGIHHLLYFPSFAAARAMQRRLSPFGDLQEGRPRLRLNTRQLLQRVAAAGADCRFAPAHVWNPFFSAYGSQSGAMSSGELFGEFAPQVTLAETGLTSTPAMCRRFSELDRCALFSSSDAHSLENIGREHTLVETEPNFDALFAALRGTGTVRTVKFPIERTRYYRNRCLACAASFDGSRCPRCGGALVTGSRDRLEELADRREPQWQNHAPPFLMLLPLRDLLAEVCACGRDSAGVRQLHARLLREVGHERFILTEAEPEKIAPAGTRELARRIVAQRETPPGRRTASETPDPTTSQLDLFAEANATSASPVPSTVNVTDDAD